jgi:hypothetical protein
MMFRLNVKNNSGSLKGPEFTYTRESGKFEEICMKNIKAPVFILGILAMLFAGCFNPTNAISPKQGDPASTDSEPFMIDVLIGKDTGEARSIAGPDAARIKGDIRNIIQLIVVNDKGAIVAFDEVRRGSDNEKEAKLRVEALTFNKKYNFLLLMGHWERDYDAESGGNYEYKKNPPTLLAAGLAEKTITGNGTVNVPMWPIVVDTVFTTSANDVPSRIVEPVVAEGKPLVVNLLPFDWKVTWTLKRGNTGDSGLTDLIQAQKKASSGSGDNLLLKSQKTIVREAGSTLIKDTTVTGNAVTLSISDYTSGVKRIGTSASVNFNLEYIPFNKTGAGIWTAFNNKSKFDLSGNNTPVWIIRNGVNDEAQNSATDFKQFGNNQKVNGNGAVSFVVKADTPDPNKPKDGDLVIKDGEFKGPASSCTPEVTFTTSGYTGEASLYYAVTSGGAAAPGYSAYEALGLVKPGTHCKSIKLPKGNENYDVYILIAKGGKVSVPIMINTATGGTSVVPEWPK